MLIRCGSRHLRWLCKQVQSHRLSEYCTSRGWYYTLCSTLCQLTITPFWELWSQSIMRTDKRWIGGFVYRSLVGVDVAWENDINLVLHEPGLVHGPHCLCCCRSGSALALSAMASRSGSPSASPQKTTRTVVSTSLATWTYGKERFSVHWVRTWRCLFGIINFRSKSFQTCQRQSRKT